MQARPQRSLQVSALGRLGISEFDSDGYVRQSIATIARALYLGSMMLDMANVYGPLPMNSWRAPHSLTTENEVPHEPISV